MLTIAWAVVNYLAGLLDRKRCPSHVAVINTDVIAQNHLFAHMVATMPQNTHKYYNKTNTWSGAFFKKAPASATTCSTKAASILKCTTTFKSRVTCAKRNRYPFDVFLEALWLFSTSWHIVDVVRVEETWRPAGAVRMWWWSSEMHR